MINTIRNFIKKIFKKLFVSEIHYINGPDLLPPPLSAEEEANAISELERDRANADILIEHNLRLVVYIAK